MAIWDKLRGELIDIIEWLDPDQRYDGVSVRAV